MSTSADSNKTNYRAHVSTSALAKSVAFDELMMHVTLVDGRVISTPLTWFPLLHAAAAVQRENYEICGGGISLHWPDIDEDLSVAGMMAGADVRSMWKGLQCSVTFIQRLCCQRSLGRSA